MAADSQTTKGIAKLPGTQKIREIKFANGKALIAESGSASLSNNVIEFFQNKAKEKQIEDELTVAKLAEESVREIRGQITSLHPEKNAPEDWQNYFLQDNNYFELMVAYYFNGKPCLYKLNPLWCIPVKATSYFMTSGIASDLANYILTEHTEPAMDGNFARVIAIKVVQDAIEYVEGCGSPPRVATLHSNPKILVYDYPKEYVDEIVNIVASVDRQTKSTRNKKIHRALRLQTKAREKRFVKTMHEIWMKIETEKPLQAEKSADMGKLIKEEYVKVFKKGAKKKIIPFD